ncbi:hypothetical protein [Draconibacterium mangrovi]|uniref:hypothetical protein n=1 Tax=Draconibacterium mangrovi TaxID=2697469 RepID=UPI0013D49A26|nr:hypothetical protein [Draconibacterium mangrovi]
MDSDQLQKVFPDTKSCRGTSLHLLPFTGSIQFHPKQKLRNFVEQLSGGFEVHYYENDDFYVTEFLWADEPTTILLCELVAAVKKPTDLHFHFLPGTGRFEIFIERYEPTYSTLNDEELDY